jgi:hypothetical protein
MEQGGGRGGVKEPTDLRLALSSTAGAMDAWTRLSAQDKQAHIASLESAPDPVARERCVEQLVHDLAVQTSPQTRP